MIEKNVLLFFNYPFVPTGTPVADQLRSGESDLDCNLDCVRLDCFGNVMVLNAPTYSDVSVQFTHGWPRTLIQKSHGGFLKGNITCTARVTNVRIRSMARGDVAAFVSTSMMTGVGLSLAELLYCRRSAILCDRNSYRLPARLVDTSARFGLNFATLRPLDQGELER